MKLISFTFLGGKMRTFLYNRRYIFSAIVFLITLSSFYINYVIFFQAPLKVVNHVGSVLYSFIFALMIFIYSVFKAKIGSIVLFIGWVVTLINLYVDLLKARIETGGTLGAALGFLTNMILVILFSLISEMMAIAYIKITQRK